MLGLGGHFFRCQALWNVILVVSHFSVTVQTDGNISHLAQFGKLWVLGQLGTIPGKKYFN